MPKKVKEEVDGTTGSPEGPALKKSADKEKPEKRISSRTKKDVKVKATNSENGSNEKKRSKKKTTTQSSKKTMIIDGKVYELKAIGKV